jgi:hypothetical protein
MEKRELQNVHLDNGTCLFPLEIPILGLSIPKGDEPTDPLLQKLMGDNHSKMRVLKCTLYFEDVKSFYESEKDDGEALTAITNWDGHTILSTLPYEKFSELFWNTFKKRTQLIFDIDFNEDFK